MASNKWSKWNSKNSRKHPGKGAIGQNRGRHRASQIPKYREDDDMSQATMDVGVEELFSRSRYLLGTAVYEEIEPKLMTERCTSGRKCKYYPWCDFAHSEAELRQKQNHWKTKSLLCRKYHESGFCSYGKRCSFLHEVPLPQDEPVPLEYLLPEKFSDQTRVFAAQRPYLTFDSESSISCEGKFWFAADSNHLPRPESDDNSANWSGDSHSDSNDSMSGDTNVTVFDKRRQSSESFLSRASTTIAEKQLDDAQSVTKSNYCADTVDKKLQGGSVLSQATLVGKSPRYTQFLQRFLYESTELSQPYQEEYSVVGTAAQE